LTSIIQPPDLAWTTTPDIIYRAVGIANALTTAGGPYLFMPGTVTQGPTLLALAGVGSANAAFYLDPADMPDVVGRTKKVRIRATCVVNATAPTSTFQVQLRNVATWGGAAGAAPTIATVNANLGSNASFAAPAGGSAAAATPGNLIDFPAAGFYVPVVAVSVANMAANSQATLRMSLERVYSV
jgi:hypothetical protein